MAGTHYFGGQFVADPALRTELLQRFATSSTRASAWLFENAAQADNEGDSIASLLTRITEQRQIANQHGLRFVAYEGGQHMHHSFAVEGLTEEDTKTLSTIMEDFVRSREMGYLYSQLWDGWSKIGEGPFMQYVEISNPSQWGSWGLLAFPGDSTPRARFLLAKKDEGGSWWGEGGGPQYLQGITASATESADNISGTDEEDYLAGLGGDDTFIASAGSDGLNGGLGADTYALSGLQADYDIAPDGQGFRVTSAAGSAYLFDFERITFGDGTSLPFD